MRRSEEREEEVRVAVAVLLIAAVFIPAMGVAYQVAAPNEVEPLWHRALFGGYAVLLLVVYRWRPAEVNLVRMARLCTWVFSAWFLMLSAVNGFSLVRAMGMVTLQFASSLVFRRPAEAALFNGAILVVAGAVLSLRPAPLGEWVLTMSTLVVMASLALSSVVVTWRTVAELARREQELAAAQVDLEEKVKTRTAALRVTVAALERQVAISEEAEARARTASVAKSSFLANMSHELRTPLNAILGYAEMVLDELDDEDDLELSGDVLRIHQAGSHLLTMINDVLDLAKVEAGKLELSIGPARVVDVVEEVIGTVLPQAAEGGVDVVAELSDDLPLLHTDRIRLKQVLVNLVGNAVTFSPGGTVTVRGRCTEPGKLRLEVHDTGIGIAPDVLPTLFDKFTQADPSSTRRHGGTGLGLAISRELARLLEGDLVATSTVGVGSCFTLTVAVSHAQRESTPASSLASDERLSCPTG